MLILVDFSEFRRNSFSSFLNLFHLVQTFRNSLLHSSLFCKLFLRFYQVLSKQLLQIIVVSRAFRAIRLKSPLKPKYANINSLMMRFVKESLCAKWMRMYRAVRSLSVYPALYGYACTLDATNDAPCSNLARVTKGGRMTNVRIYARSSERLISAKPDELPRN